MYTGVASLVHAIFTATTPDEINKLAAIDFTVIEILHILLTYSLISWLFGTPSGILLRFFFQYHVTVFILLRLFVYDRISDWIARRSWVKAHEKNATDTQIADFYSYHKSRSWLKENPDLLAKVGLMGCVFPLFFLPFLVPFLLLGFYIPLDIPNFFGMFTMINGILIGLGIFGLWNLSEKKLVLATSLFSFSAAVASNCYYDGVAENAFILELVYAVLVISLAVAAMLAYTVVISILNKRGSSEAQRRNLISLMCVVLSLAAVFIIEVTFIQIPIILGFAYIILTLSFVIALNIAYSEQS